MSNSHIFFAPSCPLLSRKLSLTRLNRYDLMDSFLLPLILECTRLENTFSYNSSIDLTVIVAHQRHFRTGMNINRENK